MSCSKNVISYGIGRKDEVNGLLPQESRRERTFLVTLIYAIRAKKEDKTVYSEVEPNTFLTNTFDVEALILRQEG